MTQTINHELLTQQILDFEASHEMSNDDLATWVKIKEFLDTESADLLQSNESFSNITKGAHSGKYVKAEDLLYDWEWMFPDTTFTKNSTLSVKSFNGTVEKVQVSVTATIFTTMRRPDGSIFKRMALTGVGSAASTSSGNNDNLESKAYTYALKAALSKRFNRYGRFAKTEGTNTQSKVRAKQSPLKISKNIETSTDE